MAPQHIDCPSCGTEIDLELAVPDPHRRLAIANQPHGTMTCCRSCGTFFVIRLFGCDQYKAASHEPRPRRRSTVTALT